MRSIVIKSGLVACASAIASLIVAAVVLTTQGMAVDRTAVLISTLCPLLIAWPASARGFLQKYRIEDAHAEVARSHEQLSRAHAELAEAHARLAERASRDAMTGLLNRENFLKAVEAEAARRRAGVLLIIDADHFKAINDNHGHETGDAALVEIARAITRKAGAGSVSGRIGGEEFAVHLPGFDMVSALSTAEEIRREVAATRMVTPGGDTVKMSVSIGGAELGDDMTVAQALRIADHRLYKAKRTGRDRIVLPELSVSTAA
ncbi:GGDEF domain-containing protein [Aquibium oceanicum]|uniref:diguanylate cyclase n=1 Tax=Aquibium oceanicum TaxID=1670800 RepID=A0A1L3SN38_9HYPH|nr:GGDEF domain-containing protein [Aquibium oceanicum]APH70819.1 hypothetical protein BSQ44_05060 [Aquibium oceanicum]